jgi:CBS domain containing-hemolysin-like protein
VEFSRDLPLILALIFLLGAAMVLAAAEAALIRVPRVRVEIEADKGDRRSKLLLSLLDDLPRVMNTVLLVVLLVQIAAATVTGILAERLFGSVGVTIASVVLTIVLFVYAEAIPKTYAVHHPLRVGRSVAPLVRFLSWLLRPVVTVLVKFADLQAPGSGIAGRTSLSEEELLRLAAESASAGRIDSSDIELMEHAFELGDLRVDSIQVPRTEIVAVAADTPVSVALNTSIRTGHRRLPVYVGSVDRIVGMVRMRDLAEFLAAEGDPPVGDIAGPVHVVPESKQVIDLLREMQRAGVYLAVAVDEHGGTAGIVTIEDVVAELVGNVSDEPQTPAIRQTGPDRWEVDGSTDVAEVERALGVDLPNGDWHTVGGMVMGVTGRIPEQGESIDIEAAHIRVLAASERKVELVEVTTPGAGD